MAIIHAEGIVVTFASSRSISTSYRSREVGNQLRRRCRPPRKERRKTKRNEAESPTIEFSSSFFNNSLRLVTILPPRSAYYPSDSVLPLIVAEKRSRPATASIYNTIICVRRRT
ncbi:hypothetical protein L596_002207 [Steinernema carpocapsae]|uniref:Uncharacterized protein n=1 Tax=Steinernema carpocapsae TaxID=34508 RepID=A0A4U8UNX3_STECR|nr:hypothetical protein L596_002207 [Steinernema carpocapsae]